MMAQFTRGIRGNANAPVTSTGIAGFVKASASTAQDTMANYIPPSQRQGASGFGSFVSASSSR